MLSCNTDHPNSKLAGKQKGMKAVLQERVSVLDESVRRRGGKVQGARCKGCKKSQVKKDAKRRVAEVEAVGREDEIMEEDLADVDSVTEEAGFRSLNDNKFPAAKLLVPQCL
ncbi:hypothetical protein FIBSPDRAFT_948259 [Athelia psychrophila]|uniref:Uncharacterized protein n=1 Tax=Athelia psychrophila TaxID=1759441 RepID=A0A166QXK5_9AGAM|nr:hypothetical protein FIBSPDRAFT_948259 [Fibularhizoctonia sp. CBS 109695]